MAKIGEICTLKKKMAIWENSNDRTGHLAGILSSKEIFVILEIKPFENFVCNPICVVILTHRGIFRTARWESATSLEYYLND